MNKRFILILLGVLLANTSPFAQAIQSGKVTTGFIECVILDSTDQNLLETEFIRQFSTMMPKETIYFNENYIIKIQAENHLYTIMDYEDRNTGLIYTLYSDSVQSVYALDSLVIWFLERPGIMELVDSTKARVEKNYTQTIPKKINGFSCYEFIFPGVNRNEEGYQKVYMTKDLGLRMSGNSHMRKAEGYPVRIDIAAAPGLEVAIGILEWEELPADHSVFKLNLEKYSKVSIDDLNKILDNSSN